jgi:hypothetical protein
MDRKTETKLLSSLTNALGNWLDGEAQEIGGLPFVGDDLCELMARAAMAVLAGQADVYDTLRRNGELADEQ